MTFPLQVKKREKLFTEQIIKAIQTKKQPLFLQIDLRFEAANIEKFRENFQDVEYVKFPTPLRPFVTRSVLVETFEVRSNLSGVNDSRDPVGCDTTGGGGPVCFFQESEPIANYLRPEVPAHVKQRIARMGIETLLKMVRCMLGWLARHYEVTETLRMCFSFEPHVVCAINARHHV